MVQIVTNQPVTAADKPYIAQGFLRAVQSCKDPEVLVEGPAGTGKTRCLLEIASLRAMKYPASRHLILRKTRASMTESVLVTLERYVLPDNHPAMVGPHRAHRAAYEYPNRSTIVVGGLDKPERLFSTEYDTVTVFEATETTEDEWELLFRALRNRQMPWGHQALADCNPGAPTHWLNQRANSGRMRRIVTRHQDNPVFYDEPRGEWTPEGIRYRDNILGRLSGHRRLRLLEGKWASAEGTVYDAFDAAIHVVDPFDIPVKWRRIRAVDFGFVNPFVCQWWAIDQDGRMYLYREVYMSGRLVEDHARQIVRLSSDETDAGVRFPTVSDHDAEDRATLNKHGVSSSPAQKDISLGIQAVQDRLRVAADGKPRLFVFRGCTVERDAELDHHKLPAATVEEFECYMWPTRKADRNPKEVPVDKDNHGMDAMRYAVMEADRTSGRVELPSMRRADTLTRVYQDQNMSRLSRLYR